MGFEGGDQMGVAHLGPALALSAVGLTAVFAGGARGRRDSSANVVAGFHHDHVFVPLALADEALGVLSAGLRPHSGPSERGGHHRVGIAPRAEQGPGWLPVGSPSTIVSTPLDHDPRHTR